MSFVLFSVHVPRIFKKKSRTRVDKVGKGEVTKIKMLTGADSSETVEEASASPESKIIRCGEVVRNFISTNDNVRFAAEIPYVNGNVTWIVFSFSCEEGYTEMCTTELAKLRIGGKDESGAAGIGMVTVVPLHVQRIASVPLTIGSPFGKVAQNVAGNMTAPTSPTSAGAQPLAAVEPAKLFVAIEDSNSTPNGISFVEDENEMEEENEQACALEETQTDTNMSGVQRYTGKFSKTIRSRIAIESVIKLIYSSAEFSFDYVMLVLVAAILACIGLVTNNVVVIVASMLVSPLMGPILGVTFGLVMEDKEMIKVGLFSELVGLFLCIVVGFIGGLCAIPFLHDTLPTSEMKSRMLPSGIYTGIAIALPSGVGVALSVLGNNTSSLVGVAISASLLPPAVNTGVCFALSALANTPYVDLDGKDALDPDNKVTSSTVIEGGGWSLLLTVVNICCIWISGYVMFKVKEVSPVGKKSQFWSEFVPGVRKYNNTITKHNAESEELKTALKEYSTTVKPQKESSDTFSTLQALNARRPRMGISKYMFGSKQATSELVKIERVKPQVQ